MHGNENDIDNDNDDEYDNDNLRSPSSFVYFIGRTYRERTKQEKKRRRKKERGMLFRQH